MRSATSSMWSAHPALAPVPKRLWKQDPDAYAEAPVGNGPFMMAPAPWEHDQSIQPGQVRRLLRRDSRTSTASTSRSSLILRLPSLSSRPATWTSRVSRPGRSRPPRPSTAPPMTALPPTPGKQTYLGPELGIYYVDVN